MSTPHDEPSRCMSAKSPYARRAVWWSVASRGALLLLVSSLAAACDEPTVEGQNPGECEDGVDNDQDDIIDCLDSDCVRSPACASPEDDDETPVDDDDSGDDDDDDDDDATAKPGDDDDSAPLPSDCQPSLAVVARKAVPMGLYVLEASGGTGDYRFELTDAPSGAVINALTGSYLAGATTAVVDQVQLTDEGCDGSASADIHVVDWMEVAPQTIQLGTGQAFIYEVEEGSGTYECSFVTSESGGSLDADCRYTPGPDVGLDLIRFVDLETEQELDVEVFVVADATLTPDPEHILISVGSSHQLLIDGGSGHLDLSFDDPEIASWTNGLVWGDSAGRVALTVTDHFTGQSIQLTIDVVAPLNVPTERVGDQVQFGEILGAGDINGDGHADALLGLPQANVGGFNRGAVYLWLGEETGLAATPAQMWSGTTWDEQLGRGLALGDFDNDGVDDLAISTPYGDLTSVNSGRVSVYLGTGTGFSETPTYEYGGDNGSDFLGQHLVACDFNGDGIDDLAAGAFRDEDRNEAVLFNNQGAVWIMHGSDDGLPALPDQTVYGARPSSSGWVYEANIRLGSYVAAGDVDGDGYCDLLAGAYEFSSDASASGDGAVFLYRGSADGVEQWPTVAWSGEEIDVASSQLGRTMAVGDVNGDGLDDIALGQWRYTDLSNTSLSNPQRQGAVRLVLGRDFASEGPATDFILTTEMDWTFVGDNSWDYVGTDVAISDFNGDGIADILVGSPNDEELDGESNTGTLAVFYGVDGGLPAALPDHKIAGAANGDWFGVLIGPIGDVEGTGQVDTLVLAGREDTYGLRVGAPHFVSGFLSTTQRLEMPGDPSGQQIGRSAAFVGDVTGDLYEDIVIGASRQDSATEQINSGAVYLYRGGAFGFEVDPVLEIEDVGSVSGSNQFGHVVSGAGDFDGDGSSDFAVIALADSRPASFDGSLYANPDECPGNISNTGALFVFQGVWSGLPSTEPAFVYYGLDPGKQMASLAGGLDVNGDGLGDLVIGSPAFDTDEGNDFGMVEVVFGRPHSGSDIQVICEPDATLVGRVVGDGLGRSVAAIGDLDGDNCDEFATGADTVDFDLNNQGAVRYVRGFGGPDCPSEPEWAVLVSYDNNARAGSSLAGGGDVDGDGYPDLAVGGYNVSNGGDTVGAAWLVSGAYLQSLPTATAPAPDELPTLWPFGDGSFNSIVYGRVHGGQFGRSVALIQDYLGTGMGAVMGGSPQGSTSGATLSGGARLHPYVVNDDSSGLSALPSAAFGGESYAEYSYLGEWVTTGTMGGEHFAIVGGYQADGLLPDAGAAYVLPLSH